MPRCHDNASHAKTAEVDRKDTFQLETVSAVEDEPMELLGENTSTEDNEYPQLKQLDQYRISGPLDKRLIKHATANTTGKEKVDETALE